MSNSETLHFSSSGSGYPFDEWPVLGSDVPRNAIPLLRPYCTLKWLLLEDPPPSRDRDDAWQYITMMESADLVEAGLNAKKAQQARARKPRVKLYDGTTINEIIADLALSPEHRDQTAEELWPHFFARLEALEHSPEEILHPREPRKCAYRYEPEKSTVGLVREIDSEIGRSINDGGFRDTAGRA
jgi:hypothetical protein